MRGREEKHVTTELAFFSDRVLKQMALISLFVGFVEFHNSILC